MEKFEHLSVVKNNIYYLVNTDDHIINIPVSLVNELTEFGVSEEESIELVTNLKLRHETKPIDEEFDFSAVKQAIISIIKETGVTIDQISLVLDNINDNDLFLDANGKSNASTSERARHITSKFKTEALGDTSDYIKSRAYDDEDVDYNYDCNDYSDRTSESIDSAKSKILKP